MTGHEPEPLPRDPGCLHPARERLSRDGAVIRERCRLCDAVLVTDRATSTTTTEVTGR